MKRIIRSEFHITLKSGYFKRYLLYMTLAAVTAAGMAWVLKHAAPFLETELLKGLWKGGGVNLGLLRFESADEIEGMTSELLLKTAYSGYGVMLLTGFFSMESFERDRGFFRFLAARQVPRAKIYCARVFSVFPAALLLFWGYGAVLSVLSRILFGKAGAGTLPDFLLFLLLQSLLVFGAVSLNLLMICAEGNLVRGLLSGLFLWAGMPVFMDFLAALTRRPGIRLLWIGSCSAEYLPGDYERAPAVLLTAVLYGAGALAMGTRVFQRKDME